MHQKFVDIITLLIHKNEKMEDDLINSSDLNGITPKQLEVVDLIFRFHNPTITELSGFLGITKPSATVLIDRLCEKKLTKRIKSDTDRRSAHLHLTQEGEKIAMLHKDLHTTFAKKLMGNLNRNEIQSLSEMLEKALQGISNQD
ncbi:MAG TPA: MarR family transcriptional regulator [Bacteroidales bacterium]|nr:MarR family transcriptional regulator [Bacteroidales bacterium]